MIYLFWLKIYSFFEKFVIYCIEFEVYVIYFFWFDYVFICLGKTESVNRARKSKIRVGERKKIILRVVGIVVFFFLY